jgi:hypothetical protein
MLAKLSGNLAPLQGRYTHLALLVKAFLENLSDAVSSSLIVDIAQHRRRIQDKDTHRLSLPAIFG